MAGHLDAPLPCLCIDESLWGGKVPPDNPNLSRYCLNHGNHDSSNTGKSRITNSNIQNLPISARHNGSQSVWGNDSINQYFNYYSPADALYFPLIGCNISHPSVSAFGSSMSAIGLKPSTSVASTYPSLDQAHFKLFEFPHSFAPTYTPVCRPGQNYQPPQVPRQLPAPSTNPPMSDNYKGNPNLPANQSDDIPDSENCAVWITRLPPECTVSMLLGSIRHCDKVYATVVNKPNGAFINSAAKVVFWSRQGVDRLLELQRQGRFTVGRYAPSICMNRIRSRAMKPGPESRILHIYGPQQIVNREHLEQLFQVDFKWEDDTVSVLKENEEEGTRHLEWRFSSYRCQAQNAFGVLARYIRSGQDLWPLTQVGWGQDPCA